jgi:cyclic pyranopterin phosphate synthase
MKLRDNFSRVIDYMRISITDRCNLRCVYCMPQSGVQPIEHREILTYEEIIRVVRVAASLGVRKIRITGGEPLARKNVTYLIASLKQITGIEDMSLTTNGALLEKYAGELAEAGLNRVNVSLDSLRPERYREITRGGELGAVMQGIEAAEKAGLLPVKINMVPIRGLNDDEIEEFAGLTLNAPFQVRFIEFMPIGAGDLWSDERYISTDEIKARVEKIGTLSPLKRRRDGPARYYRIGNAPGVVGFISALTHHFCDECNRLRITADGKLRPCLFSETEIDLKPALRSSSSDEEIERLLRLSIEVKPEGHTINHRVGMRPGKRSPVNTLPGSPRPMSRIGG